jgi:hypothetical protein
MDDDAIEKWLDDPAKWLDTNDSSLIEFDEEEVTGFPRTTLRKRLATWRNGVIRPTFEKSCTTCAGVAAHRSFSTTLVAAFCEMHLS